MKRKIVWLVFGSLVTLSLLIAACAPKAPTAPTTPTAPVAPTAPAAPTTPAAPTVKEKVTPGKEMITNSVGKLVEKPQFGGWVTLGIPEPLRGFDWHTHGGTTVRNITNEELTVGDWKRSAAGSGGLDFLTYTTSGIYQLTVMVGNVAESWQIPDDKTIIVTVRKGIRWENKPPTNGRELTAEDVLFSLNRGFFLPTSPRVIVSGPGDAPTSIEAIDKWTVKVTALPLAFPRVAAHTLDYLHIVPKDAVTLYGDFTDWRKALGTGPYTITDVVPGASYTLSRVTNYWRQHPLYPEDTMPYLDGVKLIVIPDLSTRFAAMRAGKIDYLENVSQEDFTQLLKARPYLKYLPIFNARPTGIQMRTDNPKLPWYDKRVRHALQMAINREEMKDQFYQGAAEIYQWPVLPSETWKEAYVPMDKLPASVQELFKYNPAKAKQLLTEAGYPNGFEAKVIAKASDVDMLAVIKEYWKAIGVDLEIQVKEVGVFTSIQTRRTHDEMIAGQASGTQIASFDQWLTASYQNLTMINTPETQKGTILGRANYLFMDKLAELWPWFTPYILDHAATVAPPAPHQYIMWQPWLRDYNGEYGVGGSNTFDWTKYIWIDQDLKKSLTGRK